MLSETESALLADLRQAPSCLSLAERLRRRPISNRLIIGIPKTPARIPERTTSSPRNGLPQYTGIPLRAEGWRMTCQSLQIITLFIL